MCYNRHPTSTLMPWLNKILQNQNHILYLYSSKPINACQQPPPSPLILSLSFITNSGLYVTIHHLQGSKSKPLTIISECVIYEDSLSTIYAITVCLENSTVFQFYWPLILPWRRWRRRGGWWRQPGRGHRWCGCRSAGRRTRNSLEGQPSLPKNITNFLKASLQLHSRCLFLSLLVSAGVYGE